MIINSFPNQYHFAGMSFAGINIFIITSAMIGIGIAAMIFHHLPDRFLFFP
jgi:hypothetical protein